MIILCIRSSTLFWVYYQKTVTDHPSIMRYVNKTENRIKFRVKTGFYLDLLTPERMKLLRSTKSKITKDESGENVPHLEITEVVL